MLNTKENCDNRNRSNFEQSTTQRRQITTEKSVFVFFFYFYKRNVCHENTETLKIKQNKWCVPPRVIVHMLEHELARCLQLYALHSFHTPQADCANHTRAHTHTHMSFASCLCVSVCMCERETRINKYFEIKNKYAINLNTEICSFHN